MMNELYSKAISDGRTVTVVPLMFGRARIHIGRELDYDDAW